MCVCAYYTVCTVVLYANLTSIQLRNTHVVSILCLIFVLFDEYKKIFTMKISRITVGAHQKTSRKGVDETSFSEQTFQFQLHRCINPWVTPI